MLDVARWLAEQGLGHHAEAFAENGIAGDVLRDLTDADLRELGLNLGDRKRLLKGDSGPGRRVHRCPRRRPLSQLRCRRFLAKPSAGS